MSYHVNDEGYYGEFGGAYIPEILHANVEALQQSYRATLDDPAFQKEFRALLTDYAGRPSPLYFAQRLSEK
ncbi:MAG: tryptophan synthase subunit beta, partial [Prevotellaceae bacterium]|nr:tryptophan synthase subunit beta [Prevotellaceae bacterium]